jgi:hypothetical protein
VPSRLFSVAPSFVPPVHPSFMLSLPIDVSLKELNRSLNISRVCFPVWGANSKPAMRPVIAPTSSLFISPSPQKISDPGMLCQPRNYPTSSAGKDVISYTIHWDGDINKLGREIKVLCGFLFGQGIIQSGLIPLPVLVIACLQGPQIT